MRVNNYEFIKSLSIEDMAAFIATLKHEMLVYAQERLAEQGIDSSLVGLSFDARCEFEKQYLEEDYESEVNDDE